MKTQVPHTDLAKIMGKLEETKIPAGFEREMIIFGKQVFSEQLVVDYSEGSRFLLLGEKVNEKVGILPDGVFFAEGYTLRILFGKKGILVIEFLKRSKTLMLKCKACGSKLLKGDKNCNFCGTIV